MIFHSDLARYGSVLVIHRSMPEVPTKENKILTD